MQFYVRGVRLVASKASAWCCSAREIVRRRAPLHGGAGGRHGGDVLIYDAAETEFAAEKKRIAEQSSSRTGPPGWRPLRRARPRPRTRAWCASAPRPRPRPRPVRARSARKLMGGKGTVRADAEAAEAAARDRRSRHIKATVFSQELRLLSTLGAPPRPHPQTVLIEDDATYRESRVSDERGAESQDDGGGIQDHHMLRAARAQLLEEIDSILVAQADEPRWPPLARSTCRR